MLVMRQKKEDSRLSERIKLFSDREKVDLETLKKAKKEGVIQKDLKGQWRIISIKDKEYWKAVYKDKQTAENSLKAYHANR